MRAESLVFKSSFRNRRRSISTLASVTVSFLLLTILVGFWYSFFTVGGERDGAYRLVTRNKVSLFFPILDACRLKIRALPGFMAVTQLNWFGGEYKGGGAENFFSQYGADPNSVFKVYSEWRADPQQVSAFQHDPAGAAVSQKLADRYGWKIGDRILLRGTITPINLDLTVRVIYDPRSSGLEALLFNWDHVLDSYPQYRGIQGTFVTRVDSPERVATAIRAIDDQFRNSPLPTKSETESAYHLETLAMFGNIKLLILSLSTAITFAMLLVCANTAAMSIRERVTEIAIMRTIGYSRSQVMLLLLGEAALLAMIGSVMGMVLGVTIAHILAKLPAGNLLGSVHLGIPAIIFILVLAIAVATVSSFFSVYRASHGDVVKGLRYVG